MESVRVNEQGQIIVPQMFTEEIGLRKGEEIQLLKRNGYFIAKPTSIDPWKELQKLMEGEAERVGWNTDEDVVQFIKELRKEN